MPHTCTSAVASHFAKLSKFSEVKFYVMDRAVLVELSFMQTDLVGLFFLFFLGNLGVLYKVELMSKFSKKCPSNIIVTILANYRFWYKLSSTMQNLTVPIHVSHLYRTVSFFIFSWPY